MRLVGQPTTTLLATASALAVALSGLSLLRLRMLPPWLRYLLGALAAYGVVSFTLALATATPYSALFHGGSFWTPLPFWLQGAFVGGLVVLPAALVVAVVQQGLRYFRRTDTSHWTLQQVVALALSLVMTLSGVTAPGGASGRQTTVDRQAGPPSILQGPEVPMTTRLELPPPTPSEPPIEVLVARFTALAPRIPEQRYDAEAQARTLGPGVEPIFAFVRDRIRYDAYSGVLRGANGALAARAGNAFDRSLLLAKMLAVHGVRTRFVRGDLPRQEADTLFGRIFEGFVPPPRVADSSDSRGTRADAFWARVTTRARRDYTVIRAALGTALPASAQPSREQALRDIQQHVWVQADVDGRWLDLDTSFAAAKSGHAYCAARQTVEQMPLDWRQRVTIRVTEERLEDGVLKVTPALEVTVPAVDLVDQEVFLVHVPGDAVRGGMGLGGAGAPQGGDRFAPALSIGEDVRMGRPVSFGDAGGSSGFFDALGGGGSSSAFVAEWLEFEVLRPDGRRDVTRRTLVDRATTAWRASKEHTPAALRPLARGDKGLVAPQAIRNIWFSAGPHNLRSYADMVMGVSFAAIERPNPKASLDVQLLPLATRNFAALIWADHATVPALNDVPQVRLYSDSPRIIIVSVTPRAKGGVVEEYDLRRDWLCGLARDASADALVVDRKIWFAALEGALEHEAVARNLAAAGEDASTVLSTSSLLTTEGVVVLGPRDVDRVPQLTRDPEKIARLGAAIRSGNLLAVPRAALGPGPGGWWEITPSGDARAVLDDDLNGSSGMFNSGGGMKPLPSTEPTVYEMPPDPPTPAEARKAEAEKMKKELADKRAKKKKKEGGGNEYLMTVAKVAIVVIPVATLVGVIIRYKYLDARDQLDVVQKVSSPEK
jgi:transglutaminase-like putative cysteine protease